MSCQSQEGNTKLHLDEKTKDLKLYKGSLDCLLWLGGEILPQVQVSQSFVPEQGKTIQTYINVASSVFHTMSSLIGSQTLDSVRKKNRGGQNEFSLQGSWNLPLNRVRSSGEA